MALLGGQKRGVNIFFIHILTWFNFFNEKDYAFILMSVNVAMFSLPRNWNFCSGWKQCMSFCVKFVSCPNLNHSPFNFQFRFIILSLNFWRFLRFFKWTIWHRLSSVQNEAKWLCFRFSFIFLNYLLFILYFVTKIHEKSRHLCVCRCGGVTSRGKFLNERRPFTTSCGC